MTVLIPFTFENHSIRYELDTADMPWFNAADVCAALGYTNPRKAIADHADQEDVTKRDTLTAGGAQKASYVNESGLYGLIFGSKLASAKAFKRKVTSEVLPAIRKTGGYAVQKTLPEAAPAALPPPKTTFTGPTFGQMMHVVALIGQYIARNDPDLTQDAMEWAYQKLAAHITPPAKSATEPTIAQCIEVAVNTGNYFARNETNPEARAAVYDSWCDLTFRRLMGSRMKKGAR